MTINRIAAFLTALTLLLPATARTEPEGLNRIEHIVVIYLENRSFDSLFGLFPDADGLASAQNTPVQVDDNGQAYKTLPGVKNSSFLPTNLENGSFNIAPYAKLNETHPDLTVVVKFFRTAK